METNNLPIFYPGQKVVCVANDILNDFMFKPKIGKEYTIKGQSKTFPDGWFIVELPFGKTGQVCSYNYKYFAPVKEQFASISYEKVLENEQQLISSN